MYVQEAKLAGSRAVTCLADSGACLRSSLRTASIFSLSLASTLSMAIAGALTRRKEEGEVGVEEGSGVNCEL
jgi:hypothetical protein